MCVFKSTNSILINLEPFSISPLLIQIEVTAFPSSLSGFGVPFLIKDSHELKIS